MIIAANGHLGKGDISQSLPAIANAYIQHEKRRVRPEGSRRAKGTISLRVFDDSRRQVISILRWCKQRYGIRLGPTPFEHLVTATDYESMMLSFVATRLSDSQVHKHRWRFWEIVRFGRRNPFSIRLPFGPEDVRKFGGTEEAGVCASSGAACSSGSLEPSHVLKAMGIDERIAHGAIRFSLSRFNTREEIDHVVSMLPDLLSRLAVLGAR